MTSISDDHQEAMSRLRERVPCSKGFRCVESELSDLCEVIPIGSRDDVVLQCLGEEPCSIQCSQVFGYSMRLCRCALRQYIWEHFRR